jgi:hypothetical protein
VHDVHAAATAASMLSTGLSHLPDMTFAARFDFRSIGYARGRPSSARAVAPAPPYSDGWDWCPRWWARAPAGRVCPRADSARIGVTERFPFLVSKTSPYYHR